LSSYRNMNSIIHLTAAQLRKAANLKDQIASLGTQIVKLLPLGGSGNGMPSPLKTVKPARKKISATGIAKIRAAQKARWAKVKASKTEKVSVAKVAPKKRTMSAAAKAKIAAAAKARWAKIKAAKK
jgi:hypothetical protein